MIEYPQIISEEENDDIPVEHLNTETTSNATSDGLADGATSRLKPRQCDVLTGL